MLRIPFTQPSPARAEATRFDPKNPADVAALAKQYAPIRYLHPKEKHGPADPLAFIQNSRVREHKSFWPDKTTDGFDYGQITPSRLKELHGSNLYLDLKDNEAARAATPNAPSFYQYDEKSKTMTYWYFYGYNDAPGPIPVNHEGDWERVTVQLDAQQKPLEVRYSAHDGNTKVPWAQAPKENGRPVVYVGLGSHANSPHTGTGPTGVPIIKDHFEKGQRIDGAAMPLQDVTQQPWYDIDVKWGQRGKLAAVGQEFTSGIPGPGRGKGPLS